MTSKKSGKKELDLAMLEEVAGGGTDLDRYVRGSAGEIKAAYDQGYNSSHGSKAQRNAAGHKARQAKWEEVWNAGYSKGLR